MKRITIAFSNNIAIGSKIIAASESRNYSHALIIFELGGIEVVFQASHGMVNMVSLKRFLLTNNIVVSYDYYISDEIFDVIKTNSIMKLGIPYGTMQIIYIAIMKLLNIKTIPKRLYDLITNKNKQEICSELVSESIVIIDPLIDFSNNQLDFISPSDLEEKLLNQGHWKRRNDG